MVVMMLGIFLPLQGAPDGLYWAGTGLIKRHTIRNLFSELRVCDTSTRTKRQRDRGAGIGHLPSSRPEGKRRNRVDLIGIRFQGKGKPVREEEEEGEKERESRESVEMGSFLSGQQYTQAI